MWEAENVTPAAVPPIAGTQGHGPEAARYPEAITAATGQKTLTPQNLLATVPCGACSASPGPWLPAWKPGLAQGSGEAPGQTLLSEVPGGWGRTREDWAANTSAHGAPGQCSPVWHLCVN